MTLRTAFWYINFQKGPPLNVTSGTSIAVSPTITTDLREQQYLPRDAHPLTLKYLWVAQTRDQNGPPRFRIVGVAGSSKWIGPRSSYETIEVRIPNVNLDGVTDRLHLAIAVDGAHSRSGLIRMEDLTVDYTPSQGPSSQPSLKFVPALSAPLRWLPSKSKVEARGRCADSVRLLTGSSGGQNWRVVCHETSGYELDKHIWDASHLLIRCLGEAMEPSADRGLAESIGPLVVERKGAQRFTVIELGAGTGSAALCMAAMLDGNDKFPNTKILATDLGE